MRILVANWSLNLAGGAEVYLDRVLPLLERRGHEIAFLWELDADRPVEQIRLPAAAPRYSLASMGRAAALDAAARWRPDVTWVHLLSDPEVEAALIGLGPAVRFAHAHQGMCISTLKTRSFPRPAPCRRRMGSGCLLQYFPRRCGGLGPVTMVRLYGEQRRRLTLAREYAATMTLSNYMRAELARHGVPAERLHCLPWPPLGEEEAAVTERRRAGHDGRGEPAWRLLFLGRMERMKGGDLLLDALPFARRAVARPLSVTFAGDGCERLRWEQKAARLASTDRLLSFRFVGHVTRGERSRLFAAHDLLVVPSIGPEPFGLVGLEAAAHGLPAVAFAVGGIPEWLEEGVSGRLAATSPRPAERLAAAIASALESPATLDSLSRGAIAAGARVSPEAHADAVDSVLCMAASRKNRKVS